MLQKETKTRKETPKETKSVKPSAECLPHKHMERYCHLIHHNYCVTHRQMLVNHDAEQHNTQCYDESDITNKLRFELGSFIKV